MKLLSFIRLGKSSFGAVVNGGVIDLTGKLDPDVNSIKDLISLNMEDQAYLLNQLILRLPLPQNLIFLIL